mmetsp:Transcript_39733/g.119435  ORF Transcript_39733/g.119435 Transcript_39733/m.119435 type:complete len:226 (+) Transcript_39733:529-1206(+)
MVPIPPRPIPPPRPRVPLRVESAESHGPQPDPDGRILPLQPRAARSVPGCQHRLRDGGAQPAGIGAHRLPGRLGPLEKIIVRGYHTPGGSRGNLHRCGPNVHPIVRRPIRVRWDDVRERPRRVLVLGGSVRYRGSERRFQRVDGHDGDGNHFGAGVRGSGWTLVGLESAVLPVGRDEYILVVAGVAVREGSGEGREGAGASGHAEEGGEIRAEIDPRGILARHDP